MTVLNDRHSRIVYWLKIVLPLVALVILSTLFLFQRRYEPDGSLPYSEADVAELAQAQVLHGPRYQSVTTDGAAVAVSAGEAGPDADDGTAGARDLSVAYETPTGLRIRVVASEGTLDQEHERVSLTGDVRVVTSSGYGIVASGLVASLDRTSLVSDGAVSVTGPLGKIDAGQLHLGRTIAEIGSYDLVFTGGVKLIYRPATKGVE